MGRPQPQPQPNGTRLARTPIPGTQTQSQVLRHPPSTQTHSTVGHLKTQIEDLEKQLNSARGEASFVRSELNKITRKHDEELETLHKQHAEELLVQKEITRNAQRKENAAATELEFAKRDLREDFNKAHRKQATTPKKANRSFRVGDGFEDSELGLSPSKSQGRCKSTGSVAFPVAMAERTPSKAKRKRPIFDSPMKPLDMEIDEDLLMDDNSGRVLENSSKHEPQDTENAALVRDQIRLLLNHRGTHDGLGTFEILAKYKFPSDPEVPLANKYLHKLIGMEASEDSTSFLADFCTFTIHLWNKCLEDEYYDPVSDLLGLIAFALQLDIEVIPRIFSNFLAVAQNTSVLILSPRFHAKGAGGIDLSDEHHSRLAKHIDVGRIVSVMHFIGLACASAPLDAQTQSNVIIREFWSRVHPDLIFKGLVYWQPAQDYDAILRLLQTAALPDTICTTTGDTKSLTPTQVADLLIDRLTQHLGSRPPWARESRALQYQHMAGVLATLSAFATSPFCLGRLCAHPRAIPRLVLVLSSCLDDLYDIDMMLLPLSLEQDGEGRSGSSGDEEERVPTVDGIISHLMLLLHAVITNLPTDVLSDLKPRLDMIPGTWERYLAALARLEFAEEDLILERGVGSRTLELAHELLDLVVTPNMELRDQILALLDYEGQE